MLHIAIKPGDKLIKGYYDVLGGLGQLDFDHEGAVRNLRRRASDLVPNAAPLPRAGFQRSDTLRVSMQRNRALVSQAMSQVRSKNTSPEKGLCKALRARGLRLETHCGDLPGKPDVVFRKHHLAVFIDGDFWHGRQWRARGFASLFAQMRRVNNSRYWIRKITNNVRRDARARRALNRAGWSVIRIWESRWQRSPELCLRRIELKLKEKTP